jgi:hypothetical protein
MSNTQKQTNNGKISNLIQNIETISIPTEQKERPEEYSTKFVNLLTEDQILECLKGIDDESRKDFLETLQTVNFVKAKYVGLETFGEDSQYETNTYLIKIKRNGKTISFKFHNSYNDTINMVTVNLYDILSCVASDGTYETETFSGFCSELEYDEDSRKAFKMWKVVKKQQDKILSIFEQDELYSFPR